VPEATCRKIPTPFSDSLDFFVEVGLTKIRPTQTDRQGGPMQSIRLHTAGDGAIWAMSKCEGCGDVAKHPVAVVIAGPITCKRCGRQMDMKHATVDALAAARETTDGD
jgi:hypothetical protein